MFSSVSWMPAYTGRNWARLSHARNVVFACFRFDGAKGYCRVVFRLPSIANRTMFPFIRDSIPVVGGGAVARSNEGLSLFQVGNSVNKTTRTSWFLLEPSLRQSAPVSTNDVVGGGLRHDKCRGHEDSAVKSVIKKAPITSPRK